MLPILVRAAVKVEGFRNSLTALYGDAQIAERVLNDLRDAAQLARVSLLRVRCSGAIRLKTVGIEGDRATKHVIKGVWKCRRVIGCVFTEEMTRAIIGFDAKRFTRGRIRTEDNLNQILENVPIDW